MASTIPTNTPNTVGHVDDLDPDAGNAAHQYVVMTPTGERQTINFQHGQRNEPGSFPGIMDDDLLAIVEHRLSCFESGPFAHRLNDDARISINIARKALAARAGERLARDVLGKNVK